MQESITTPERTPARPFILSFQDLDSVSEIWDNKTGAVSRTTFTLCTADDSVFQGEIAKPRAEISPAELDAALQHIPDEDIFPPLPTSDAGNGPELTVAPDVYVKQPTIDMYETVRDRDYLYRLLLGEARVMERLARDPHPGIVQYHGVRVRRGRVTGIALDRHPRTLLAHLRDVMEPPLEEASFLLALESAVLHLHSLGLAHNDINPENVMVNGRGLPVLIDFGSCRPFGERLMTAGTVGWIDPDDDRLMWSEKKHDDYAVGRVRDWLKNPKFD